MPLPGSIISPKRKKMSAKSTEDLNQLYFPTINGKSVEVVTSDTANTDAYRKNFDILKFMRLVGSGQLSCEFHRAHLADYVYLNLTGIF